MQYLKFCISNALISLNHQSPFGSASHFPLLLKGKEQPSANSKAVSFFRLY